MTTGPPRADRGRTGVYVNTREQPTTERGTALLLKHIAALTCTAPRATARERLSAAIGNELAGLLLAGLVHRTEPQRERVLVF